MIRINLLPFRAARTKENIRRQVSVFLLSVVLLLIVLVLVNGHLAGKVVQLEDKLGNLQAEVKVYEEKAKQVENFKRELEQLTKKIEIVNQLKDYRKDPPLLLADLTELVVPGRMQLSKMSFVSGQRVSLEGVAMDNETIAVFMRRLEQSGRFSSVRLARSVQQVVQNIDMKQFDITCQVAK
jgi:type IV pilus assembly protein PilN